MNYTLAPKISRVLTPRKRIVYMTDPVRFTEEIIFNVRAEKFGGDLTLTDEQKEMMMSIVNNRRVANRAGRGIGKTAVLAFLIIWWLSMFEGGKVIVSAPSFPQLTSVLWPEVAKWLKMSLVNEFFTHTAKKLYLKEDPKNTFAEPRTATKEESMQGLHETHLLILLDEAPGIEDKIWDVVQGSLTKPNNKVIVMGNPARTSGFFFDAFHKDSDIWATYAYNSENSKNVDQSWLDEMKSKYVQGDVVHDLYKVHVLGMFPSGDPDAFISLESVTDASYRTMPRGDIIELGVDVARKGNDLTVIAVRHGDYVDDLITMNKVAINETVDKVLETVAILREEYEYTDVIRVKVDDTGVGAGVTDYLAKDREHNIEVVPCNFGGAGNTHYSNEASIMWGTFKDTLPTMHLPSNTFLLEELSTRKWELDGNGRIRIQRKKDFKKDYGSSPDHADAIVLCFADKTNELRLIKSYDAVNQGSKLTSNMLMHGERYASLFLSKKGKLSAVFATYTGHELRVFDEYVGDSSDILHILNGYGPFAKVVGNSAMFTLGSDDIYLDYSSNGIFISESYGYDKYGATRMLETLASRSGLITAVECTETSKQLRTWSIDTVGNNADEHYGMCMALLHIVSELSQQNSLIHDFSSIDPSYVDTSTWLDPNIEFLSM